MGSEIPWTAVWDGVCPFSLLHRHPPGADGKLSEPCHLPGIIASGDHQIIRLTVPHVSQALEKQDCKKRETEGTSWRSRG